MLQKKYYSELISIVNPFNGIYTLEFKSLVGKYKYLPGQFLHIALDQDYDGSSQWPNSRCFSMQSNPSEDIIRITYTVKGAFTKQMEEQLRIGLKVWLKLPYGDLFTQPHNKTDTVFISGGTGITPYLSLFTHESFNEYINPRIYLGFRCKAYNIYEYELKSVKRFNSSLNPCLTIFYQDTDGVIDINFVCSENSTASDYFISGPPEMIKSFRQTLINKGVDEKKILTDDWE